MFNLFAPRSPGEDSDETLYPKVAVQPAEHLVELDAADGTDIKGFLATGIEVKHDGNTVMRLTDSQVEVLVTDTRVTVAIKDWVRPGHSLGVGLGALRATISNMAENSRAQKTMAGRIAVAQIKYHWVAAVAGHQREYRKPEYVAFQLLQDDNKTNTWLFLTLDKRTDSMRILDTVARRTAHWKAENYAGGISDEELTRTKLVAANPAQHYVRSHNVLVRMPNFKRLPPVR